MNELFIPQLVAGILWWITYKLLRTTQQSGHLGLYKAVTMEEYTRGLAHKQRREDIADHKGVMLFQQILWHS